MKKKNKSESNFLVQGSILAVASIVSRIIGLIYRVPLTGIIGDDGNNYYSTAYEIYNILLLISSYSLPLAVSKLVSQRVAKGERRNAYKVFKGALLFACISGLTASLIVYFGAGYITNTLLKTPLSIYALKVLAPTLFVVAILGVIRGFFQGMGTMMPSAVSQVVEQIVNAIVSVWAAYLLYAYGARIGSVLGGTGKYAECYGAAGGTLGTNVGSLFGLIFVLLVLMLYMPVYKKMMRRERGRRRESYRQVFRVLLITIIPVLMSTTIYNISSILDQGIFKNLAVFQNYSDDQISSWWGIFSGKYKVLTNVPISIASAMAASCVPSLTSAYAEEDMELVKRRIASSVRFVMVIAFPCTVGMGVLASPILQLLFGDNSDTAALMLSLGCISILFYSLSTLTNGILQGINRMRTPVRNAALALVIHMAFLVVFMLVFRLHIYGVIWANIIFAAIMCFLNNLSIRRYTGYEQEWKKTFFIPAVSAVIMGIVARGVYLFFYVIIKSNAIAAMIAIFVAVIVYAVFLIYFKGMEEEDLESFPKGHLIIALAKKVHLM